MDFSKLYTDIENISNSLKGIEAEYSVFLSSIDALKKEQKEQESKNAELSQLVNSLETKLEEKGRVYEELQSKILAASTVLTEQKNEAVVAKVAPVAAPAPKPVAAAPVVDPTPKPVAAPVAPAPTPVPPVQKAAPVAPPAPTPQPVAAAPIVEPVIEDDDEEVDLFDL